MRDCDLSSHAPKGPSWAARFHPSIEMCDDGLVFGGGSRLMRMTGAGGRRLALDDDRARVLALLSVVYRRPVGADVLIHLEAVSAHWQRGDKALANLRLVFAGLPRLEDPADAARLRLAEYCLDEGLPPRALMIELVLDPSALDAAKTYDPEEPRDWRGRWTDAVDVHIGAVGERGDVAKPVNLQIAANGPFKPDGENIIPIPGINPLDPQGLNTIPGPGEEQAIADTLNTIRKGTPEEVGNLNPHPYKNFPDRRTGAILPPSLKGYTTYDVLTEGVDRGTSRIVIEQATGDIYYTNTHYLSFYHLTITSKHDTE